MRIFLQISFAIAIAVNLTGCLTSVVTLPVKVAYGTGKLAVKGTAAAVRAVIPNDEYEDCLKAQKKNPVIQCKEPDED
ncbi:NF038104 family lipoprotein [Luteimonas sp. FXH3W]|uniref:NF038104 family lipoprotein n=1 Tax=Aquilutibacter rugosus TaxID=3115820 RepID=A0ABU7UYW6_9GAMM